MAVILAAALAAFSPRGTLADRWADEPVQVASIRASPEWPFDTTVGHRQAASACPGQMQELLMQYGGDGIGPVDLESACTVGQTQAARQPAAQD